MSEVMTRQNSNVSTGAEYDPYAEAAQEMGARQPGGYIKFSGNTGEYTTGKDDLEVPYGTQFVIDPDMIDRGWICWMEGDAVDEVLVNILRGAPPKSETELPDHGPYKVNADGSKDGWSQIAKVPLFLLDCEEQEVGVPGTRLNYAANSKTAYTAIANFIQDYARLRKINTGKFPVVEIGGNSFKLKDNPKAGKKYAPTFTIKGWLSREELDNLMASAESAVGASDEGTGEDDPSNYTDEPVVEKTSEVVAEKTSAPASEPSTAARARKRF
jgi:hypothetical protein